MGAPGFLASEFSVGCIHLWTLMVLSSEQSGWGLKAQGRLEKALGSQHRAAAPDWMRPPGKVCKTGKGPRWKALGSFVEILICIPFPTVAPLLLLWVRSRSFRKASALHLQCQGF